MSAMENDLCKEHSLRVRWIQPTNIQ